MLLEYYLTFITSAEITGEPNSGHVWRCHVAAVSMGEAVVAALAAAIRGNICLGGVDTINAVVALPEETMRLHEALRKLEHGEAPPVNTTKAPPWASGIHLSLSSLGIPTSRQSTQLRPQNVSPFHPIQTESDRQISKNGNFNSPNLEGNAERSHFQHK